MMNRTTWSADDLHRFLSVVSHDLRTPLTVITGRASVLREAVREDQRRDLDVIVQQAHGLSYTFENLLAIIETRRDRADREWIPLEEIVGAVLVRLASVLDGRTLRTHVPEDLLIRIHPARGELLISNLLRRAAAHAPPATPIELNAKRVPSAVSIEVVVRGPEPAAAAAAAPQPLPDDLTRADSLELAACHAIVSSYGGALQAGPRPGDGTVLHVCIPDGEPLPDLGPALENV